MGRQCKLTSADVSYAVELYKQYKKGSRGTDLVTQLATKFGVSKITMYNYLRKGGIYNPHMGRKGRVKNEDQTA